jgi:DNA topoisomerase-1
MPEVADTVINLPKRKIKSIIKDSTKAAEAVNLVYVNDSVPGILRVKKGKTFDYVVENKKVRDKEALQRIKSLVIPPAWENVWICALNNGHLQATGIDAKNRKQYKYHPVWNALRNHTKFYRLLAFGDVLPKIRLQLEKHLSLPGLPVEKVLATVVSLMERTNIRVGNNLYEKLYGSFGLTTLKDKHVKINGTKMKFYFKGKKGIYHDISFESRRLASIVKKCQDIPGKELFQYYDDKGERRCIDSGMVNDYIKEISGGDFTAKDFRTWAGTVNALLAFKDMEYPETQTGIKKKIVEALDIVAKQLGNTRTVCKKYYVHPIVISLFESKSLDKYLSELDAIEVDDNKADLSVEEKVLMKILSSV